MRKIVKYRVALVLWVFLSVMVVLNNYVQQPEIKVKITDAQVQQIYDNLWKYSGSNAIKPNLIISNSLYVNAQANYLNNYIEINRGLINFVSSKDELSWWIGHEIAHMVLDHQMLNPDRNDNIQIKLENNADKFAIYLMLRAGYNICTAKSSWIKFRGEFGELAVPKNHPSISFRIYGLDFPMCKG